MKTGRGKNTPSADPGAKEVLEFLAENQSFRALYKKFPYLKKEEAGKILIGAVSCFKSKIKERKNKNRPRFTCYVDGAAQPNPGPAGAGAVIYRDAVKVKEISK